jgi:hypothetical protein
MHKKSHNKKIINFPEDFLVVIENILLNHKILKPSNSQPSHSPVNPAAYPVQNPPPD